MPRAFFQNPQNLPASAGKARQARARARRSVRTSDRRGGHPRSLSCAAADPVFARRGAENVRGWSTAISRAGLAGDAAASFWAWVLDPFSDEDRAVERDSAVHPLEMMCHGVALPWSKDLRWGNGAIEQLHCTKAALRWRSMPRSSHLHERGT